ncbi:MAG TPA: hypothetical protein VGE45_11810 [Chloroflexia bacterium]|jgi:hypothetical protein
MKTWMKVLLITIPVAIISLPIGQMLWPAATADGMGMEMEMSVPMLLGFIGVSVFEGLALGVGVSFLVLGLPVVRRLAAEGHGALAWSSFAAIIWFLVSWWPHDGLHRSMGDNMTTLLAVEYGFHVTLIIAGAILAYAFVYTAARLLGQRQADPSVAYPDALVRASSEV